MFLEGTPTPGSVVLQHGSRDQTESHSYRTTRIVVRSQYSQSARDGISDSSSFQCSNLWTSKRSPSSLVIWCVPSTYSSSFRHAEPHHTQRVIMERLVQLALFGVELHVEQRDLAHIVGR
jgi:hypothetical protein